MIQPQKLNKLLIGEPEMRKFKENAITIRDWSFKALPAATGEMQILKLEEELKEVRRAENTDRWLGEMADVYVVACILWERFHRQIGKMTLSWLEMLPEYGKIRDEVDEKMKVNRLRQWHINENGVYHH